mmetsp:Transcript_18195/g.43845  ORF Transcript_18195/g.43845 Transcript_18195/m.43845 type:complete len:103 (-) Transcript_18195:937-1245(-)
MIRTMRMLGRKPAPSRKSLTAGHQTGNVMARAAHVKTHHVVVTMTRILTVTVKGGETEIVTATGSAIAIATAATAVIAGVTATGVVMNGKAKPRLKTPMVAE